MADKVPGPPVIDSSLEGLKRWQLERQLEQSFFNRKSRYPPFCIEPVPYTVQRTGRLMTDEERFLRKQWLKDQILAPSEPRVVPEAVPMNNIRRFYMKPLDAFQSFLSNRFMSPSNAELARKYTKLLVLGYAAALFIYYQTRYTHNTWEKFGGVMIRGERRIRTGDDSEFPAEPNFGDSRFSERSFRNS